MKSKRNLIQQFDFVIYANDLIHSYIKIKTKWGVLVKKGFLVVNMVWLVWIEWLTPPLSKKKDLPKRQVFTLQWHRFNSFRFCIQFLITGFFVYSFTSLYILWRARPIHSVFVHNNFSVLSTFISISFIYIRFLICILSCHLLFAYIHVCIKNYIFTSATYDSLYFLRKLIVHS